MGVHAFLFLLKYSPGLHAPVAINLSRSSLAVIIRSSRNVPHAVVAIVVLSLSLTIPGVSGKVARLIGTVNVHRPVSQSGPSVHEPFKPTEYERNSEKNASILASCSSLVAAGVVPLPTNDEVCPPPGIVTLWFISLMPFAILELAEFASFMKVAHRLSFVSSLL